jgi:hypothetical protein
LVRFAPHIAVALRLREMTPAYGELEAAPVSSGADDTPADVGASTDPEPDLIPDPFSDADALEELEEEIVVLAAHENALAQRQLVLIAEFDRRRGFELGGHRSTAHWLACVTGIDLGTAREKVRTARALTQLPRTRTAMGRGELSFSQARALTRVATPENEEDLLELATGSTVAVLERVVRGYRLGSRQDETERERARLENRELSVFPDEEGMCVVRARLTPEIGALFMRAIEAASDALYRAKGEEELERVSGETSRAAAQRRADALGLLAERAMAAGFTDEAPVSGTRPERYQVVLHVDAETLSAEGEAGLSELEDGTRVSHEMSRRIACDASVVPISHACDGEILGVGRKTRTIPPALRRALEARDRGCRFPGCGLRFTDAHHIRHWADGGETSLPNLILLCSHHHRLVHEQNWKVEWWGKGRHPAFLDPRGQVHLSARPRTPDVELPADPVAAAVAEHEKEGIRPVFHTVAARWKRESDIPDRVWFAALEALG